MRVRQLTWCMSLFKEIDEMKQIIIYKIYLINQINIKLHMNTVELVNCRDTTITL